MGGFVQSRRGVIGMAGAGLGALAGGPLIGAAFAAEPLDPDIVVHNAKVYTVDDRAPRAEAFAIKGDRFVAVGSSADMKALAGPKTRIVDAQQATVVPGFIDCHVHARGTVLLYEVLVQNPFDIEFVTIASIVEKLRAKAAKLPAGEWVEGYFFDDTKVKDKRIINRFDLDKVSTEHPVVLRHRGGHTAFFNSKALAMAGITRDTPDPAGGTFDKDAKGELDGRVTDRAIGVVTKVGTRPQYSEQETLRRECDGLAHISKEFVRYGLTGVHHQGGNLYALQQVRARGDLRHRVSFETSGAILEAMIANGIATGFGDEWIRLGATSEHSADGSFSERTMAISTPYKGVTPEYKGNITETQDVLDAWVEKVHRAGIQVNCHANGDVAIASVLTAYERAQKAFPRADARPKITHCTLMTPDLIRRIKALGAIPAAFTTYAYYNPDKFGFYGEEMMSRSMAFRSFIDAGITACAGSDFSPGPFAPLTGLQGMVTRTGWNGETWGANQRVSVAEALKIYTLNGAYASREETIKGSITPVKLADYVVLADDPHTIAQDKIREIKILRTVTGGNTVYEA